MRPISIDSSSKEREFLGLVRQTFLWTVFILSFGASNFSLNNFHRLVRQTFHWTIFISSFGASNFSLSNFDFIFWYVKLFISFFGASNFSSNNIYFIFWCVKLKFPKKPDHISQVGREGQKYFWTGGNVRGRSISWPSGRTHNNVNWSNTGGWDFTLYIAVSLSYLGGETDDHHRNPNSNTETI